MGDVRVQRRIMEHFIKLVEVLIWPLIVLVCLFLFKNQIAILISKIKKIKKGDTEVTFEHEIKSLEAITKSKESQFSKIDSVLIQDQYEKLHAISKLNKRKSVIDTWEILEGSFISKIRKHYPKIAMQKHIPTEYRGKSLLKDGMIPSDVEAIRILAELKNQAFTSDTLDVDDSTVSSYIENALKAAYYINNVL